MPRLARPTGGGNAFRALNNALHDLHALASWPSLDEICAYLRLEDARRKREGLEYARLSGISRVNISRLFSSAKLPRPDLLLAVVEYLAKRAYRLDVEKVLDRFDQLWRRALSEDSPPAPGPDGDDEGPDAGPDPARPQPRGPRPSGAPATDAGPSDDQPFSLLDIVDELRPSDPDAGRRRQPSTRLLMVNLTNRRGGSSARLAGAESAGNLTDRAIRGWSQALSMGNPTVVEQPTAADLRRRVAETLNQPLDTAVLWLNAPVIWDSATGEAHFVTRDSEFDAQGTLWNTVSYTEIQYAVARSVARAVVVVVVAGRSRRVADVYGASRVIPVGRTQWGDTLYAGDYADDDALSPTTRTRPVFLLWLPDADQRPDYPGTLLHEIQRSTLPDSELTTGALFGRLRELADRLGCPEPYGAARYGGEAIVLGRWSKGGDAGSPDADAGSPPWLPRFVLRATSEDVYRVSPAVRDTLLNRSSRRLVDNAAGDASAMSSRWRSQVWQAGPELAHSAGAESATNSITVAATGRFAGNDVVVAAFADNSLRVFDPSSGQLIHTHAYGHTNPVTALAIGTIAGHDVLAVAFADDSLQLWDATTGRRVQTLSHSIGPVVELSICNDEFRDFVVAEDSAHRTWLWEVVPG
jgi:FOG: WD40 repeat